MTFLNVGEIESALVALSNSYPSLTQLLPLPNITYEGRRSNALLIRANPGFTCRPALMFVSGVHAREWGGPDILVNLAADLLEAYTTNSGLAYGIKSFSAAAVKVIVWRQPSDVAQEPQPGKLGRRSEQDRRRREPELRLPLGFPGEVRTRRRPGVDRSSQRGVPRDWPLLRAGVQERPMAG